MTKHCLWIALKISVVTYVFVQPDLTFKLAAFSL